MASWGPCNHSAGPSPLQIEGSTRAFPKTKEQYVNWGDEDFMDGSRGSRSARLRQGDVLGGSRGAVMRAHVPSSAVGMSMFAGKACCCNGRAHFDLHTPVMRASPAVCPLHISVQVCEAAGAAHGEGVHQQAVSGGTSAFCFPSPRFFLLLSCYTVQLLPVIPAPSATRGGGRRCAAGGGKGSGPGAGGLQGCPDDVHILPVSVSAVCGRCMPSTGLFMGRGRAGMASGHACRPSAPAQPQSVLLTAVE